ncbi:MAG: hypothetical protein E7182_06175 [Erysipelotrichaceae bacterium]|nr:hypothetical protein [Erysipelotrichaceae bacterium]
MDKDLGYQELLILAKRLEARAAEFSADADESQEEGMNAYAISQENSIEQARFVTENYQNEFLTVAKACIENADNQSTLRLLRAYGEYGLKEN